ncbi:MAG: ribosomal protein S18-alanine N-acetyltransferase [Ahrensia sp.]|nr:ribosomal protein S18-alanine N-acetyltransferase [Ahrensia sp.]
MIWPFLSLTVDDLIQEPLSSTHADEISAIHAKTFDPSWSDGEFQALINTAHISGLIMRTPHNRGGEIVGFVLMRAVVGEAEILTIAIEPKWQQRGVGHALMESVVKELKAKDISSLFLEVAEANWNAVKLYQRLGFEQVATRKNYYHLREGVKSNALVMRRDVV